MMQPTSFVRGCPVCGRPLEILVRYLGRRVTCQHCGGRFIASDPASRGPAAGREVPLLERAERLLGFPVRRRFDAAHAGVQSTAGC